MPSGVYLHKPNQLFQKGHSTSCEVKEKISVSRKQQGTPWWIGREHSQETKIKIALTKKGDRNARWLKDRSLLKSNDYRPYDTKAKMWASEVKARDSRKCKISDKNCRGRLEAHHILGWTQHPELRYELNNGITLCLAHHPRKRAEEKRLSPYFQGLVSVSKD